MGDHLGSPGAACFVLTLDMLLLLTFASIFDMPLLCIVGNKVSTLLPSLLYFWFAFSLIFDVILL